MKTQASRNMSRSALAIALLASTCLATAAQAQEAPPPEPTDVTAPDEQPAADEPAAAAAPGEIDAGEVVITGTSIRGVAPVGSSLISLGRADIESSTAATTTQIIREIPQIFNFGVTDSARNQAGGAGNIAYGNSINIRGIGPYATLTLLNSRRAVNQGTLGANFDPSIIPAIALQRIEIIADGASAIYGSDAVSGVANLILRRNYDGVGVEAQYGVGENYHDFTVSGIFGMRWETGRFTVAAQHAYRSAINGIHRDIYASDLRDRGGSDYRVTQCNPGTIQIGATTYAIPIGGATPTNLVAGTINRCDNVKVTDIQPQQELNSATFTFDQDLGDSVHFFADGLYSRRDAFRRSAVAQQTLVVPTTNAFFVAPAGAVLPLCPASAGVAAGTRCENVLFSFANIFGPTALTDIQSDTWQLSGGFDVDLWSDWNLNVYVTRGENHDHVFTVGNGTDTANLAAALRSSTPATAFNPFGTTTNSQSVIDSIFDNLTDTDGRTWMWDTGARVGGPLFALPGGEVKLALGAEYYDMRLRTGQIRGRAGAQTGTDQRLSRNVTSGYAELLIPIFGPENATGGFERLEIDAAVRYDDYSDVGSTTNPKFGINWEPIRGLKFHGSYGTSFRAPLLTQIVSASGSQLFIQNYFDPTANGGAGATVRGVAQSGGNLGLVPETAETWSFGVDYAPSWRPGMLVTLNYFDIVYEGQIQGYLSNLNVLRQEALFSSIILRGAAAQTQIASLVAAGLTVNGGSVAEALAAPVFVDGRNNNLGTTIANGIDFGLVFPWTIGENDRFRFTLRGTRFFHYKVALTPGGQINEQLNNIDFPLKFRARGSINWEHGPASLTVFANYQNGYNNTFFTPAQHIDSNTTIDLAFSYDLSDALGSGHDVSFGIDVTNLFDTDPPFADIAPTNNGGGGFDPTNASLVGRVISASLRFNF
jgi:iron complex outermembrane receptor protein